MKSLICLFLLIILVEFQVTKAQVEISGAGAGGSVNGLIIQADNCVIKGLIINRFGGSGIVIQNSSGNKILGNTIGTDNNSTAGIGNGANGISIINSSNNIIGEPFENAVNIIAGNSDHGILISGGGSTGNKIQSNFIGTDSAGANNIGNGGDGICIVDNASNNIIGGDEDTLPESLKKTAISFRIGNVITNCTNGIFVNANLNKITGNLIGIFKRLTGGASSPLGNIRGILIQNGQNNSIFKSIIGANKSDGVRITGSLSKFNKLFSSIIGSDSSGTGGLGNLGNGVCIDSSASDNSIGGCDSLLTIVANQKYGIEILNSTLNKINGVFSGIIKNINPGNSLKKSSSIGLGNVLGGLRIYNSGFNKIGNPCAKNIFAANGGPGITLEGLQSIQNFIQSSLIGTDDEGTEDLGNDGDGILLMDGANDNLIGGDNDDEHNISVSNNGNGISLINTELNKIVGNISGMFKPLNGIMKNMGNKQSGLLINNSSKTTLFKGLFGGNVDGIRITGISSTLNKLAGIISGTDSNATQGLGNSRFGLFIDGLANNNFLGGLGRDSSIVVGGNGELGILLKETKKNQIHNALVGIMQKQNQFVMSIIKNLKGGIEIQDSEENELGKPEMPNMIGGNGGFGLLVKGTQSLLNKIKSSFIGTDSTGASGLGNAGDGVCLMDGASNNIIGGENPGEGNISADNGKSGFAIMGKDSKGNGLIGNFSGFFQKLNLAPKPLGNLNGFLIDNAIANIIKKSSFAANKQEGGKITGPFASLNNISGCFFGTDSSFSLNLGNLKGLTVENGANNNAIGDTSFSLKNLFANNKEWGLIFNKVYKNYIINSIIGGSHNSISLKNLYGGIKFIDSKNNSLGRPAGGLFGSLSRLANLIEGHDSAGVAIINSSDIQVIGNDIQKNNTGVLVSIDSVFKNALNQMKIINNKMIQNLRAFEGTNSEIYFEGNNIDDNTGIATGLHLYNTKGKITGNLITNDAGDGIALEDGSNPVISKNNIYDNDGFGLRNFDQSVFINAQNNWWGNPNGPGGNGSGSGDEVSMGIDFSNWKNSMVSLVASAGRDTLYALPGSSDIIETFITNFQNPSDVVNVSISDQSGWLSGQTNYQVNLADDNLGAAVPISLNIPSNVNQNSINKVWINAASQTNPGISDADSFYIVVYQPQLTSLFIAPDTAIVGIEQTYQFAAPGFDQNGQPFNFNPQWNATGGTIDESGLYTAGTVTGTYAVTVSDPVTQLQDNAVVIVTVVTDVEETEDESIPEEYTLYQNYPNPFNPSTTIKYAIPFESNVSIKIYNILGELVADLVNEFKTAGYHQSVWSASYLASGIYIYWIEAKSLQGNQVYFNTRKMILLK